MKAALIIPVHNRRDTTLQCLANLKRVVPTNDFQVIVVDDGSDDGTGSAIRAEFPDVLIVEGDGNLFWGGAIRLGMRRALEATAEFLFWLNDDCLPERGTLERMLEFLEQHPKTICGASCYFRDTLEPVQTGFRGRTRVELSGRNLVEVQGLSGYCVGIPAEACDRVGLPNAKRLPHYAADTIYTLLLHRNGFRIVILPDAKAFLLDRPRPESFREQVRQSNLPRRQLIETLLLKKKSRYYLPGQFWYHYYKYGLFLGPLLFACKALGWLGVIVTRS
jgi:GT2 family glycosyltransferase